MDDDLTRALEVHVAQMDRERRCPWMEPRRRSVGLDENNLIVEYVATENRQLVPVRVLGREGSSS